MALPADMRQNPTMSTHTLHDLQATKEKNPGLNIVLTTVATVNFMKTESIKSLSLSF